MSRALHRRRATALVWLAALALLPSLAAAEEKAAGTPATAPPARGQVPTGTPPAKLPPPSALKDQPDDLFVPPALHIEPEVKLGPVRRSKLPNGLELVVVPRRQVPSVEITLAVKVGEVAEPLDQSGLSQFVAQMLRQGTRRYNADQIADAIDFVGGSLAANAGDEGTFVSCHARARDLALCLELVAEAGTQPTFPESELGEVRERLLASVEAAKDSPRDLGQEHAANVFYGDGDPRGRAMSERSLGRIDRAALVAFHQRWFAPNNAILAIAGDVDEAKLRAQVARWFGRWKQRPVPPRPSYAPALPPPPSPPDDGKAAARLPVRLVDKPDATQATLFVLGRGVRHADPDYYAVRAVNYTLGGGGFSSRLMRVVRSEGGKTYGASSSFSAGRDAGPFYASTFTRSSETTAVLGLVLAEIERMRARGPTAEELQAAKNNLVGGFGLRLETGSDLAAALLGAELDGLDPGYVAAYPARLNAVTLAEAARVAAAHLEPAALVVVAKAAAVKPMLEKAGYTCIETVGYLEPVSAAERHEEAAAKDAAGKGEAGKGEAAGEGAKGEAGKGVDANAPEAIAGRRLVEAALAAKGGAALARVGNVTMIGSGTLTAEGHALPVRVTSYLAPGKSARQEIGLGGTTLVQVLADGQAWVKQGDRVTALPAAEREELRKALWRDPNFVLAHAAEPGVRVRAAAPVSEGGVRYDVVDVIAGDGEVTRLWLHPATHQLARLIYRDHGREARDELGDYRSIAGVAWPHALKHVSGSEVLELSYREIRVNDKLAAGLFTR